MQFLIKAAAAVLFTGLIFGTGCASAPTYAVRTYRMGDRVQLGSLIYIVYDSQWLTHAGNGASARIPESRFFVVRVSITNSGAGNVNVPAMTVTDEDGKQYSELTNGDQVSQWLGFLRAVKPADSLQGNVVFDCPPRRYNLKISDETEQRTALIDIPLTFGSETPEIPSPELPEKK
jgi:hypothetical protein